MVSISLYRGNLHRVSDAPRHYPMPPRTITLDQFRILTRRRDKAIARLAASAKGNPSSSGKKDEEEEANPGEEKKDVEVEEGEVKTDEVSDPQPNKVGEEAKGAEDSKEIDARAKGKENCLDADAVKGSEIGTTEAEVSNNLDADIEKRRVEVETKLEALKQKKHHLVQILKQILHVEEEIKGRNAQSAALRASIPLQTESAVDMGSATRHVPKLSVEVNFGGDLGAESDATANHSAHRRQMHHVHGTSPSVASLTRPSQQNTFLPNPRSSLVTSGQGQTSSNVFVGNTATATSSPSRFAPTGHQGHQHSASLPPVSIPGSHFMASSPSPAASGSASSAFKDSRLTSSS